MDFWIEVPNFFRCETQIYKIDNSTVFFLRIPRFSIIKRLQFTYKLNIIEHAINSKKTNIADKSKRVIT